MTGSDEHLQRGALALRDQPLPQLVAIPIELPRSVIEVVRIKEGEGSDAGPHGGDAGMAFLQSLRVVMGV